MAVFGNNTQTNVKAITETVTKEVARMKLNNGVSPSGQVSTVNQSIGSLNPDAWDGQKVMNIVEALSPCLTKSVYDVEHVRTSSLTD